MKKYIRVSSCSDSMISCGRTTGRPGREKYYNSIRFSGWTISKKGLLQALQNLNNRSMDELKRNVRVALSEAEGAITKLRVSDHSRNAECY